MPVKIFKASSKSGKKFLEKLLNRAQDLPKGVEKNVRKIGLEVKKRGDEALISYTEKFDGVRFSSPEAFKVSEKEFSEAYRKVSPPLLESIKIAIQKVESFHRKGLPLSWCEFEDGITLGQKVVPVERAGLYVPGGKGGETPLISTVIMTGVPAKIAGVKEILLFSPPRKDGSLHPALLVAAKEVGIEEVFKIGGPWAIFAMAYGTESIPKVDVICGPGNIYVTAAKKLVSTFVGIDMLAGPSEVLIIADEEANPEFIAWDLLAQAEHDPMSLPLLITPSYKLALRVKKELEKALSKGLRAEISAEALQKRGGIIITETLSQAFELANLIAPEHLELCVNEPMKWLSAVKNAGAVFLGNYTPEALGDYIAGPNHVLPTMGLARFASSLSVDKFLKKVNFLKYEKEALLREAEHVIALAEAENLPSHAEAVRVRCKNIRKG